MKRFLFALLAFLTVLVPCLAAFAADNDIFSEAGSAAGEADMATSEVTVYFPSAFDHNAQKMYTEEQVNRAVRLALGDFSFLDTDDEFREAETAFGDEETGEGDRAPGFDPSTRKLYTEEQLNRAIALALEEASNGARTSWTYLPGYIVYSQANKDNCGPACVQAALKYINGSAPDQSAVAGSCGTNSNGTHLGNMQAYLNGSQSRNEYAFVHQTGIGDMGCKLYRGVAVLDAPPIIGLSFSVSEGWYYTTSRHFMSVYGARSDYERFALADPYVGYAQSQLPGVGWSYAMSGTQVFNAYDEANMGFIY